MIGLHLLPDILVRGREARRQSDKSKIAASVLLLFLLLLLLLSLSLLLLLLLLVLLVLLVLLHIAVDARAVDRASRPIHYGGAAVRGI